MAAQGSIDAVTFEVGIGWVVHGWAFDPDRAETRLAVEIVGADSVLGSGRAAELREDLRAAGIGDGSVAFRIPLRMSGLGGREQHMLSLCQAGGGVIVPPRPFRLPRLLGAIERVEGFVVVGWACDTARSDTGAALEMQIDGEIAGRVVADLFREGPAALGGGARHGFEWVLPRRCADGQPHRLAARFANTEIALESPIGELLMLPGRVTQQAQRLLDLRDFTGRYLAAIEQELRTEARAARPAKAPTIAELLLDSLDPAPEFGIPARPAVEAAVIGFE